jgi:hypothetical protein
MLAADGFARCAAKLSTGDACVKAPWVKKPCGENARAGMGQCAAGGSRGGRILRMQRTIIASIARRPFLTSLVFRVAISASVFP